MSKNRYQAVVIRNNQILLLKQTNQEKNEPFWSLPGGRREDGESEFDCVRRELKEETGLDGEVVTLLFDEPDTPSKKYDRRKTYLCLTEGEPTAGIEPGSVSEIHDWAWVNLSSEQDWDESLKQDPFVYPVLNRVRSEFGYDQAIPFELDYLAPVLFSAD